MANVLASKIHEVKNLRQILRSDVELASRELIGCLLKKGPMVAQIVEAEAYTWDDPGCHAYKKERMKNMAMYGDPGTAYIYFTYGNHWMLNIVADEPGTPGAVLIRAAMPISGLEEFRKNRPRISKDRELMSGPGRLAQAFGIDNQYNGIDLLSSDSEVQVLPAESTQNIGVSKRIGIAPGKGDELLRRHFDVNLIEWVTRSPFNKLFSGTNERLTNP